MIAAEEGEKMLRAKERNAPKHTAPMHEGEGNSPSNWARRREVICPLGGR